MQPLYLVRLRPDVHKSGSDPALTNPRQLLPQQLATKGEGRRHDRRAKRRLGVLDQDQGAMDRERPVRGAEDLE